MKKLSKILSRRARAEDPAPDRALGPGLGPPSDFHQLPSRLLGGGVVSRGDTAAGGDGTDAGIGGATGRGSSSRLAKRKPRSGPSRIVAVVEEGAPSPCEMCARIDFPALMDWRPGDARPWVPLSHTLRAGVPDEGGEGRQVGDDGEEGEGGEEGDGREGRERPCPFCVFFQTIIGASDDASGKRTSYLRIRLAFERLGGGERHGLGKSVLIEVTTGSRRLPWGYIVKAAEDELDMAGYVAEMDPEQVRGGQGRELPSTPNAHTETGGKAEEKGTMTKEKDKHKEKGRGKGDAKSLKAKGTLSASTSPAASTSTSLNTAATIAGSTVSIQGRTVPPLLDPALPKTWIDFCKTHHSKTCCHASNAPFVQGLRLMDLEQRCVVSVEDMGDDLESLEYVALSYVWGVPPDETEDNTALPEEFPPLAADAMSLTKAIGFRYLWVDRYCILPLEAAHRKSQIEQMGQIYARAALTLIVAGGDGILDGIPGVSVPREEQLSLKTSRGLFTTSLLRPDLDIGSSKWATKSWTFQGGLLARRRLVLTPSQAYFQCLSLHCHESILLPLELAPELNLGRVFPTGGDVVGRHSGQLKNHIKAYMTREPAFDHDRLDGFRGILREYAHSQLAVSHFLGLPLFHPDDFVNTKIVSQTDRLAVGLGWMPDRILPFQGHVDPYFRPDETFPSWTWLAWRLRPGQSAANHNFHFYLVGETSPVVDGVCATPKMEISVGFLDGMVLSWEIDGDAIARKTEIISFLRLETFCFDLEVESDGEVVKLAGDGLSSTGRDAVEAWVRAAVSKKAEGVTTPMPEIKAEYEVKAGADVKTETEVKTEGEVKVETEEDGKTEDEAEDATEDKTEDNTEAKANEDTKPDTSPDPKPPPQTIHLTGVLLSGRNWKSDSKSDVTILICANRNLDPTQPLMRLGALGMTYDTFIDVDEKNAAIMGIHSDEGEKKNLQVKRREIDLY